MRYSYSYSDNDNLELVFTHVTGQELIKEIEKKKVKHTEKKVGVVLFNVEQAESIFSYIKEKNIEVYASPEVKIALESKEFIQRMKDAVGQF